MEAKQLLSQLHEYGMEFPTRMGQLQTNIDTDYTFPMVSVLYTAMRISERLEGDRQLELFIKLYASGKYDEAQALLDTMQDKDYYPVLQISQIYQGGEQEGYDEASSIAFECLQNDWYKDIVVDLMFQEAIAVGDIDTAHMLSHDNNRLNDLSYQLQLGRYQVWQNELHEACASLMRASTSAPQSDTDRLLIYYATIELTSLISDFPSLVSDTISAMGDKALIDNEEGF